MLLGLWLPGIVRVRLQCSVCPEFLVFFLHMPCVPSWHSDARSQYFTRWHRKPKKCWIFEPLPFSRLRRGRKRKNTMVSTNMWKKWNLGVHMHMKPCHQHFPSNDFPTHHYRCQVHRRLSPETLLQNYSPKFSHFVSLLRTSISMWLVAGCRARTKTAEQRHANASSKITIGGNCEPK